MISLYGLRDFVSGYRPEDFISIWTTRKGGGTKQLSFSLDSLIDTATKSGEFHKIANPTNENKPTLVAIAEDFRPIPHVLATWKFVPSNYSNEQT